jgi:hypothetical protein
MGKIAADKNGREKRPGPRPPLRAVLEPQVSTSMYVGGRMLLEIPSVANRRNEKLKKF